jgi:hypothetical protein
LDLKSNESSIGSKYVNSHKFLPPRKPSREMDSKLKPLKIFTNDISLTVKRKVSKEDVNVPVIIQNQDLMVFASKPRLPAFVNPSNNYVGMNRK